MIPVLAVVAVPDVLMLVPVNDIEEMLAPVPAVALTLRSALEKPCTKTPQPLTVAFAE